MKTENCYFYGIEPFIVIFHGEWADPEITDGLRKVNYYDIENSVYDHWKSEVRKDGDCDNEFEKWMTTDDAEDLVREFFYS